MTSAGKSTGTAGTAEETVRADAPGGEDAESMLSLRLAAEHASLLRLREAVRHWLVTSTPASVAEQHDILLATWEACANAIEHPLGRLHNEIGVELELRAGQVDVAVRDAGLWLQHRSSPQSFGIRLIEALMDSVEVARSGEGSAVSMCRRLRAGRKDQVPRAS